MKMSEIQGVSATFARLRIWNEAQFDYDEIMACVKHGDVRKDYLALHRPPMLIVRWVRFDREVSAPGGNAFSPPSGSAP